MVMGQLGIFIKQLLEQCCKSKFFVLVENVSRVDA